MSDIDFMQAAMEQAKKSLTEGGIPIGSVLVHNNRIIGAGHNQRVQKQSPVLHGEMDAIENAGPLDAKVYRECTIYTTLSPCAMCSGTMVLYGIPRVVIGENKTFVGEEEWLKSRGVELDVLDLEACKAMMRKFIAENPELWAQDIGEN